MAFAADSPGPVAFQPTAVQMMDASGQKLDAMLFSVDGAAGSGQHVTGVVRVPGLKGKDPGPLTMILSRPGGLAPVVAAVDSWDELPTPA